MKKLIGLSLGALVFVSGVSFAGQAVRSPKEHFDLNYTLSWTTGSTQAGALYAVQLGSANAFNDYVTCRDSAPTVNQMRITDNTATIGPRIYYSSSAVVSNTVAGQGNVNFVFDPPLLFFNGLVCTASSASDQATIVYEQGRGLSGQ